MFDPSGFRILLVSLSFLFLGLSGNAQFALKGRVTDAVTHAPVPSANVFLSNTSVSTITSADGEFSIRSFPAGRYELVISSIGYETVAKYVSSNALPALLELSLQPKVNVLKEVVVEPYDKDGWEKWGQLFIDNFIGNSSFAKDCELINRDVLRFRYSSKKNAFRVNAEEPLTIMNEALGYIIKYDLERFEFDLNNRDFLYKGYAQYEEMRAPRASTRNRWARNREDAYLGSVMHFMRALWNNKFEQEQFEVHKILPVTWEEKERIRKIYKNGLPPKIPARVTLNNGKTTITVNPRSNEDSLDYYKKVKQAEAGATVVYNQILTADSISERADAQTVVISPGVELLVIYLPKKNLPEFKKYLPALIPDSVVGSQLSIIPGKPIAVLSNGAYFEGTDISFTGFMAWWGKMCNKLPFDYIPADRIKQGSNSRKM